MPQAIKVAPNPEPKYKMVENLRNVFSFLNAHSIYFIFIFFFFFYFIFFFFFFIYLFFLFEENTLTV